MPQFHSKMFTAASSGGSILCNVTDTNHINVYGYFDDFSLVDSSSISGDPTFVGLRGQTFQVHGVDGFVYNLISDPKFQLNSLFVFLDGPRPCPVIPSTGMRAGGCWSHPGSYLGDIALMTSDGNRLLIKSGSAKTGFLSVHYNDINIGGGFNNSIVQLTSTHEITITLDLFIFKIENIDSFVNLASISLRSWSAALAYQMKTHGLLGQTWKNSLYKGSIPEIEGEVDDYVILGQDMFGSDFVFNRFNLD